MIRNWLRKWLGLNTALTPVVKKRKPLKITDSAVGESMGKPRKTPAVSLSDALKRAAPTAGVVPSDAAPVLAMDDMSAFLPSTLPGVSPYVDDDLIFPGFAILAMMAQRVEYRLVVSAYAREMTRNWIEFKGEGKDTQIAELDAEFKRFGIRELIGDMIEKDGYFGRGHIYVDMGKPASDNTPLPRTPEAIGKNSVDGFRLIDPSWIYPAVMNTLDPRKATFYKPSEWFCMGDRIHADRLLTLVMNPVSDLMKPLYSYGGISRSQLIKPYVDNWLRDRQSISDTLHSYAVWKFKTNMDDVLQGGALDALLKRVQVFTNLRDNRGMAAIDKDAEEIDVSQQTLSGLPDLQNQSRDLVSSFAGVPLVILLGVTPAGLNASSDGEIRAWYDRIMAEQEKDLRPIIQAISEIIQLSKWGKIDPSISFRFVPLYQIDEVQEAAVRKADAETDAIYINAGVLAPEDSRTRLAQDETSKYHGVTLSEPPPPETDDGGLNDEKEPKDKAA